MKNSVPLRRGVNCAVPSCPNSKRKNPELVFPAFPKDIDRCRQWLKAVGNEDLLYIPVESVCKNRHVCSKHFSREQYAKPLFVKLKKDAVPDTFNANVCPLKDDLVADFPLTSPKLVEMERKLVAVDRNSVLPPDKRPTSAEIAARMTARCLTSLSKEEFKDLIGSVDVVLSDCDGVLWEETEVISGSPEAVAKLKDHRKRFIYVTNNNTKTRSEFVKKCKALGYEATLDEIVCTSYLAAVYLQERGFTGKVYLVGSPGTGKELEAVGIQHFGVGADPMEGDEVDMLKGFVPDKGVGAVVVGFDKHFSYPKMTKAVTYLADPSVHFVGTNADTDRPSPNSNKFPGSGCFIRAIEAGSNRKATIVGKPEPYLRDFVINKYGLDPKRTLMIGDNCKTDILLGKRSGFKTLLVLSGVTKRADLDALAASEVNAEEIAVPDFYVDRLSDILRMF